jgi:hypothetical protein
MIELFGKEIPSKMDELTLEQFQKISAIHNNDEYDTLEKHCKVFEYLGITEEEMDVDFDLFLANVKEFNNNNYDKKDPVEEIEIDGYTYKAEMKLSVKDSRIVEKIVKDTEDVRVKGKTITEYVDREVVKYENKCPLPVEVIRAHNAAATMDPSKLEGDKK